jgi:glucosamine--fructose-6-phosphate aminotransferase (isomerizing)
MKYETIKEIIDQPTSWNSTINYITQQRKSIKEFTHTLKNRNLIFTGCGTSYYLGLSGASVYTKITKEKANAFPASDLIIFPESIFSNNTKYLTVPISRSGTTTETVKAAISVKKDLGIDTLALSCYKDSELAHICDIHLIAQGAAEKSVVMTKSFTTMLLIIQLISAIKVENNVYEKKLLTLPEKGKMVIEKYQSTILDIISNENMNKFIYLGQGPYYGLACESMLKIKEMSLSTSESYHTLEFRHGPKSLVDSKTLVVLFLSDAGVEYETNLLQEIKQLGARTLVICETKTKEINNYGDYIFELKSGLSDYERLILYMPITQLLGYYRAVNKGLDPDNPKNLTQVVTL